MKTVSYKRLLTLISVFCLSVPLFGQAKIPVRGEVRNQIGEPLVGVTVFEEGNVSNGTATGTDGGWTISVPPGSVLVFTCLGYEDVKERVRGRSVLNISMSESSENIAGAEIVSVGYGSVARKDLTGSVGKVNMDDISRNSAMNFDQAIAGRIAGVVVSTSDGAVGAPARIVIRGNNSLTQSSASLYVVDGFPTESSLAAALNPSDIESVDVLKDASASAIYGARGANGVIVITTKRGRHGKPQVHASASWAGSRIAKPAELLNGYEFVRLHDEYCAATDLINTYFSAYNDAGELKANVYNLEDYRQVRSVDWQDYVYRNALTQNYNVSVSGGSKQTGSLYNVSFAVLDQEGILVNSEFRRYSGKINFTQEFSDHVSLDLIAGFSRNITDGLTPSTNQTATTVSSYLLYSVWGYRPVKPIRSGEIDSDWLNGLQDMDIAESDRFRFNPAASVRNEYRKRRTDYFNANSALNIKIAEGLKLRISGGCTIQNSKSEEFNGSQTSTGYPSSPLGWGVNASVNGHSVSSWLNENTLTYTGDLGSGHNVQALVGVTAQGEDEQSVGIKAFHIKSEQLGIEGINTGDYQNVTPYRNQWTMVSGLARLNYNYLHRYYATLSFRADGSSKFPKENRWGYFPSGSAAWTFSNENFIKKIVPCLSNGKLRGSWGRTGNNRTTTPYDFYSRMATMPGSTESLDYVLDNQIVAGYGPVNMYNKNLRWETTEQTDLGLDLGLFDSRIALTLDVYWKNTRDLLLNATLPSSSGYTQAMVNVGSMKNRGFEMTLDVTPLITKNFLWTATVNLGINRNTVCGLANEQPTLVSEVGWNYTYDAQIPYVSQVGKPTGMMYGYIYEGTYKADDFVSGTTLKDGIPYMVGLGSKEVIQPGDPKYRDINGDGKIDENDRTVIGIGQPLHTGGFNNSFRYKGFELDVFFIWSYGNDILNANRLIFENYQGTQLNQFRSMSKAFSLDRNPDSDIPRAFGRGTNVYSSRVVEDGSFLRLKTISLGYNIPAALLRKIKIPAARIYVTGENIVTFTRYSGADPEVSTRNSVLTPGFDWSAYPRARSITAGISLTL